MGISASAVPKANASLGSEGRLRQYVAMRAIIPLLAMMFAVAAPVPGTAAPLHVIEEGDDSALDSPDRHRSARRSTHADRRRVASIRPSPFLRSTPCPASDRTGSWLQHRRQRSPTFHAP